MSARDVLSWALRSFPEHKLALLSAFGPGSLVLIHMLSELRVRLAVIFLDTLHHFPETLEHVERVRERYDLSLRVYRAAESRTAFEARHGASLWERDLEAFQKLTKVEPFRRAVAGLDAYITGRRRDQAPTRAGLETVEGTAPVVINPLVSWTHDEVWRFIRENDVPYNPLHDDGYASIGDAPLTTPVGDDEPERAGRWRGLGRLECGIHLLGPRTT